MTTALAALAFIISLGALGIAGWNARSDSRSATAAEDSAVTSRQAADHARESAEHAKASAEAAEHVAQTEIDRDHEANRPTLNGDFRWETQTSRPEVRQLVYTFQLDRPYEANALLVKVGGQTTSPRGVTGPYSDGKFRVHLEDWPEERTEREWEILMMRFWPPQKVDGRARPWTCRCGGELKRGEHAGHWDWSVKVEPPKPRARKVHFA